MRTRCSHGGPRCILCLSFELNNIAEKGAKRVQRPDGIFDFPDVLKSESAKLVAIQLQAATEANDGSLGYYDGLIHSSALRKLSDAVKRAFREALRKGADEESAEKKALAAAKKVLAAIKVAVPARKVAVPAARGKKQPRK